MLGTGTCTTENWLGIQRAYLADFTTHSPQINRRVPVWSKLSVETSAVQQINPTRFLGIVIRWSRRLGVWKSMKENNLIRFVMPPMERFLLFVLGIGRVYIDVRIRIIFNCDVIMSLIVTGWVFIAVDSSTNFYKMPIKRHACRLGFCKITQNRLIHDSTWRGFFIEKIKCYWIIWSLHNQHSFFFFPS